MVLLQPQLPGHWTPTLGARPSALPLESQRGRGPSLWGPLGSVPPGMWVFRSVQELSQVGWRACLLTAECQRLSVEEQMPGQRVACRWTSVSPLWGRGSILALGLALGGLVFEVLGFSSWDVAEDTCCCGVPGSMRASLGLVLRCPSPAQVPRGQEPEVPVPLDTCPHFLPRRSRRQLDVGSRERTRAARPPPPRPPRARRLRPPRPLRARRLGPLRPPGYVPSPRAPASCLALGARDRVGLSTSLLPLPGGQCPCLPGCQALLRAAALWPRPAAPGAILVISGTLRSCHCLSSLPPRILVLRRKKQG